MKRVNRAARESHKFRRGGHRTGNVAGVISPSPSVVSPGLATAALQCQALDHARQLAEWVGPGKELTARGVPKPAAAVQAVSAYDASEPAPFRASTDL